MHYIVKAGAMREEIQRMIDACGPGDSLEFERGVYVLDAPLSLPDTTAIESSGGAVRVPICCTCGVCGAIGVPVEWNAARGPRGLYACTKCR